MDSVFCQQSIFLKNPIFCILRMSNVKDENACVGGLDACYPSSI